MALVDDLIKEVGQLKGAGLKKFKDAMGGIFKGATGGKSVDPLGNITGAGEELTRRLEAKRELLKSMGANAEEASKKMSQLEEASYKLFNSTEQGIQAFTALGSSMQAFSFISADATVELSKGAMVLEKFGVSTETLGGILDTAALSFGATEKELMSLTNELGTVVSKFPGQAAQISQNFKNAQQTLAYDSSKIMNVFKKLQATSAATGVGFDSLTSAFGDSMDTFDGSSKKAGNLNAILGKSVFNSIDLLGKSEAERVETIISGVKKNVNVEALKKNKFQLKSVAAGLGLSVDETRRLLSGKTTVEDALKGKESKDPRVKAQKMATEAMNANTMNLEELANQFKSFRSPLEEAAIALSTAQRQNVLGEIKSALGGDFLKDLDLVNAPDAFLKVQQTLMTTAIQKGIGPAFQRAMTQAMAGDLSGAQALGDFIKDNLSANAKLTKKEKDTLNNGVNPSGNTLMDKRITEASTAMTAGTISAAKSVSTAVTSAAKVLSDLLTGGGISISLDTAGGQKQNATINIDAAAKARLRTAAAAVGK